MKKILFFILAAALLVGCKAKEVEVRVSTEDLQSAIAGEDVSVRFVARFENFGKLDEKERAQLDAIQNIVEAAMEIDDYNLVSADSKTTITVEGEIPIHIGEPGDGQDAFALYLWPLNNELLPGFTHAMQLNVGKAFNSLQNQMKGISYMLAIDTVQPVTYRLRANSGAPVPILAGGGQMDGNSFAVRAVSLKDGERTNITFSGGAYDSVYGGMLIALP